MSKPPSAVVSARQKMVANISFAPDEFVALNVAEDNRMKQVAADDAQVRMLLSGAKFLKLGRPGWFGTTGSKKWKFVYCDFDGTIFWADCDAPSPSDAKHAFHKSDFKFSPDSAVSLAAMTSLVEGKISAVFKQDPSDPTPPTLCLSLIFPDRSLDLVAQSAAQRDEWAKALRFAWQNVKKDNQIGLAKARSEQKDDPTSEVSLSSMLTDSHKSFGMDRAPKGPKLAEINLRTKDKTEARLWGIETAQERNEELEDFKKKIGSPDRCAQYSWDMCMVFDLGSEATTIAIPKVHIASKTIEEQAETKRVSIQSTNLAAAQKALKKLNAARKRGSGRRRIVEEDEDEDDEDEEDDDTEAQDDEEEDDEDDEEESEDDRRVSSIRNRIRGVGASSRASAAASSKSEAAKRAAARRKTDSDEDEDEDEDAEVEEEDEDEIEEKAPPTRGGARVHTRARKDNDEDDGDDAEANGGGNDDNDDASARAPEVSKARGRKGPAEDEQEEAIKSADEFMTERELFTRTTVQVIQSLHVAGLKTCIYNSADGNSLICLIGATEARLEAEAARIGYELQLDPIECLNQGVSKQMRLAYYTKMEDKLDKWGTVYGPFFSYVPANAERHRLYRRWSELPYHINSFFRSADRIKLTTSIIENDLQLGGAGVSPHHFVHHNLHSLHAFYPLEQPSQLADLKADALSFTSSFMLAPPIEPIRTYFGEQAAMLFAFVRYFCYWLLVPAGIGIFIYAWEAAYGRVDSSWACFYGVLTSAFSLLFLEVWKRKQSEFRVEWGMLRFRDRDVMRPQFFGEWVISDVNGRPERHFKLWKRLPRYLITYSTMLLCMIASVVAVVGLLIFRMTAAKTQPWLGPYYFSCLNAVQIQLMNWVWELVAVKLTNFENHRVQSKHDLSLLIKSFVFKLVNSYISLFYMAFLQSYDPWVPDCKGEECLAGLQKHLGFLVITQLVFSNLGYFVLPAIVRFIVRQQLVASCCGSDGGRSSNYGLNLQIMDNIAAESASAAAQIGVSDVSPAEVQAALPAHDSLVQDYEHLLFQFGYATLFSIAFPLAPLCILVSTIMWSRNLMIRMCTIYRRPEPMSVNGIGPFFALFNIMSAFAIVTNMGIVMFATSFYSSSLVLTFSYQLVSFIVVEHSLLVLKLLLVFMLDDVPSWVRSNVRRQEVLVGVLLYGQQERRDMTTLPFVAPPQSADGDTVDWTAMSTDPRDIAASSVSDFANDF